jgi:tetratricopeptide (TPR) repeat protein
MPASVQTSGCPACESYTHLLLAYQRADSAESAARVAREWVSLQPENPAALLALTSSLEALGRPQEAAPFYRRLAALRDSPADSIPVAHRAIRAGNWAAAERQLRFLAGTGNADLEQEALWLRVIFDRVQGRYAEGRRHAALYRERYLKRGPARHPTATPLAVVLMETGQAGTAAAMFDTMYSNLGEAGSLASTHARSRAWILTLKASALAMARDTTTLARLADSVQTIGARSGYGRDPRLHHHVRGLLFLARGDPQSAERAFRLAIYSTTAGYTRTNLELARVLVSLDRPAEAIPLLETALRAPLDASGLYVTQSEIQEALGGAHEAAGDRDSAGVYYRKALASWNRADPLFRPRVHALQERLAAH